MKKTRKKYTKEDDDLIKKYVSENPYNLRKAFKEVAEISNRSWLCVKQRYYLKRIKWVEQGIILFSTISHCEDRKDIVSHNSKNYHPEGNIQYKFYEEKIGIKLKLKFITIKPN